MANHLINETSPYLLQHAHNPVDWYPWGEDALFRAVNEDKPIFLSIGYAACHWCHVMEKETFSDVRVAEMLNQHFISIKVDREERPDLDDIYMTAVVAMTGQGGWPMSVFLTPDLHPFYGGTYFPPVPRYGMPAFLEVVAGIHEAWKSDRENVQQVADQAIRHIRQSFNWDISDEHIVELVHASSAAAELIKSHDNQQGGWGRAPKFPQAMSIEFLLAEAFRSNQRALDTARQSLDMMQKGGLFDVISGGFHRYSTDNQWLVPHFEKMLYDNALLARAYLHAYLLTADPSYLRTTTATLDFILREMTHPLGGFYSSLDADSEGEEGKYYLWTYHELRQMLSEEELDFMGTTYRLPEEGNFEGKIILQRFQPAKDCAANVGMTLEEYFNRLDQIHQKLFVLRSSRKRPATDDKVLVSWNALANIAFSEAGFYLGRQDYLQTARTNASFLLNHFWMDGRLMRSWRDGIARTEAFLEDYAGICVALFTLFQYDPDLRWFSAGKEILAATKDLFEDQNGSFFDAPKHRTDIPSLPKNPQDNATPSGNALAAHALLLLSELNQDMAAASQANKMLASIQDAAQNYPTAFGYWLQVLSLATAERQQVLILYPHGRENSLSDWFEIIRSNYHPHRMLVISRHPPLNNPPELVNHREIFDNHITAYVCRNFVCLKPTYSIDEFKDQIRSGT